MRQRKKKKKRKISKKSSRSRWGLICVLAIIVLIPVLYGVYLYCEQLRNARTQEKPSTAHLQTDFTQEETATADEWQKPSGSDTEKERIPERKETGARKPTEGKRQAPPTHHQPFHVKELEIPTSLTPRQEQIIHHTGYTVSYNKDLRLPNWVSYELTRQETKGKEKRGDRFVADPQAKGIVATNADYKRSGYDKGHMAPAGDMKWNPTAMKESFYFSNMCPQHPQLNRRAWKDLEEKIRDWAVKDSAIIVICGPIVGRQHKTIGKNKVVVPNQFFKVVLSPYAKPMRAIGFLFNNQMAVEPLSTYSVTVDRIEQLTGMDFFAPLPDEIENKIEADDNFYKWPH